MCGFRTPPCVPGKRPHVQHMRGKTVTKPGLFQGQVPMQANAVGDSGKGKGGEGKDKNKSKNGDDGKGKDRDSNLNTGQQVVTNVQNADNDWHNRTVSGGVLDGRQWRGQSYLPT